MHAQVTEERPKIRPIGDRILVRKCYVPDADDGIGGIILPETAKDFTNIGVVMAIGPKVKHFVEGECFESMEFDSELGPTYIQGPGGKYGISQYVQKNTSREEGDEYFIREEGIAPAFKFRE